MTARVRDYLYLDPTLVAQTLSQLDFGVFKEWEETLERAKSKEGGLSLTLFGAANLGAKGTGSQKEASSVVFEQTAESYASRLLFRLEEEAQLLRLGTDTDAELRRGSVVVAGGNVAEFEVLEFDSEGWSSDAMDTLFGLDKQAVDLEKPSDLGTAMTKAACVIRVGRLVVVAPLIPDDLRVPIKDMFGEEAELVGIVRRLHADAAGQARSAVIVRPIAIY
jgi:hypothetical protein